MQNIACVLNLKFIKQLLDALLNTHGSGGVSEVDLEVALYHCTPLLSQDPLYSFDGPNLGLVVIPGQKE